MDVQLHWLRETLIFFGFGGSNLSRRPNYDFVIVWLHGGYASMAAMSPWLLPVHGGSMAANREWWLRVDGGYQCIVDIGPR